MRKGEESYADPNAEAEMEAELEEDARIDLAQVGSGDDSEETARARANAIRDKIVQAVQNDEAEWEEVSVDEGGESE